MPEGWAGWIFGNILLPVAAPVVLVSLVRTFADAARQRDLSPLLLVKDGQISWAALLFASSAVYEREVAVTQFGSHSSGIVLALAVLMVVTNAVVPLCGLIFPVDAPSIGLELRAWMAHYKLLMSSIVFAAVSAACYTVVHFGLFP